LARHSVRAIASHSNHIIARAAATANLSPRLTRLFNSILVDTFVNIVVR